MPQCREPKDQDRINKNKRAQSQNQNNDSIQSQQQNQSGSGYKRGKFGKPTDGRGIRYIKGRLHCACNKCGWNLSHSTKFHDQWENNKSNFRLPDSHPYSKALGQSSGPKTNNNSTLSPNNSANANQASVNLQTLAERCAKLETETSDASIAAVAGLLKQLFSGKE